MFDGSGIRLGVGGDMVTLATDLGSLSGVTDNGDGTYSATLASFMTVGTATITGTVNGENLVSFTTVDFTAP